MNCPRCGASVASGQKFCGDCGTPLALRCPACGRESPPGKRFCAECGAALSPASSPPELPAPTPVAPGAERRVLTVMFADLVGSTALASRLDPEDLRDVIAAYHGAIAEAVGRHQGFVARYMGDGVLVYFGYPQAHEDDAEQAVRAGLAVVEAVGRLEAAERLQVRLGIATGLVIVGDLIGTGAAQEQAVVGETPNLAARLQMLAEPNTVVIDDGTRRLVGLLFETEDLGPQPLKGFAEPQRVWRVSGESRVRSRFEALRSGETPLIDRDEEMALLLRRWNQAKQGDGRVVVLSAEPGIGKSRLTAALQERLGTERHTRLRYFCSPHHQESALYPIIGHLERAAGFARGDSPDVKRAKLEALLASTATPEADVALLAELLSLPRSGPEPPELTPQRRKEKTFEALLRRVTGLARQQPVLVVFEDLQWVDPTSFELLDLLIEQVERLPMLLIATLRPEIPPPWAGHPQVTALTLTRLDRREGATLVRKIAGDAATLPSEIVDEIVERTDGVPLFLEELTKAVLEAAAAGGEARARGVVSAVPGPAHTVPATLQASLLARLDRLGPAAKEAAQAGAAIGREFSYELLAAVAAMGETELKDALDRLVAAGLVFRRGVPPHANLLFKHALVQDAAYSTLLRGPRQGLHARVAQALVERFAEIAEKQPEVVAHHFAEAGAQDRAIDFYLKAAEHATGRSALAEMVGHLRKGLAQLAYLPASAETLRRELGLQVALGRALIDHKGSGSPEVGAAFERARELCLTLDETKQLLQVHDGLFNYHFTHSEPERLLQAASEMRDVGRRTGDPQVLLMARRSLGAANLLLGRFEEARDELQLLLAAYEAERHGPQAALTARDPKVSVCTLLGICLTAMGYPDSGAAASLEGIRHAEALGHVISLILGLRRACVRGMVQQDTEAVFELSGRLLAVNAEYETFLGTREGTIFHAWAQLRTRPDSDLVAAMQTCLAELDAARHCVLLPFFMASAAELQGAHGDIGGAVGLLDRAAELVGATRERWCEPEILRLRARFAARDPDEAAGLLQAGLSLAQAQGAKLWELRTARSLAELWRDQGKTDAARALLEPLCAWFTEGAETVDLVAARSLLEALRG